MAESQWYYAASDRQHGPVTEAELKRLLASGEVASTSLVWRDGMGEWQPAGQMSELGAVRPAVAAATLPTAAGVAAGPLPPPVPYPYGFGPSGPGYAPPPPAPPAAPLAYGGYSPYPPGQYPPPAVDPGMAMLLPIGVSGWAIASGYLGLFSVLLLPAPLAVITAALAFALKSSLGR